jgi:carbamoyltransferase
MKFIGLRLDEHDSNISYSDGSKVKYYKSERDNQVKHHGYDDLSSWKKIIDLWEINPGEVDAIGIVLDSFKHPNIKCNDGVLYETIDIPLFKFLGFTCPVYKVNHHYAHALSMWTLGVDSTIDFVFDAFGDDFIAHTIFRGTSKLLELRTFDYPSLGHLMSTVGKMMGMKGHDLDFAGKVMALKAYGNPLHILNQYDFSTLDSLWLKGEWTKGVSNYDRIATAHEETEKLFVKHIETHSSIEDIISYSGGVAQNTIINTRLKRSRPNLNIPPHCNDDGLSLGVIEFLRKYFDQEKFDTSGFPFWQSDNKPKTKPSSKTIKETAERLARGEIVGWYQGHGEVGPRALGNRSILMNPAIKNGKDILNNRVKHRESFRPFGASVLENKCQDIFDWEYDSPYMLYVMDVKDKDSFPSITHADGTCRPQTVTEDHEIYYELISEFENLTGIPMLLNTSLNNNGKPICGSPNEALELFSMSDMNCLVIGDDLLHK